MSLRFLNGKQESLMAQTRLPLLNVRNEKAVGSMTQPQLAFLWEICVHFPWKAFQWDGEICSKLNEKKPKCHIRQFISFHYLNKFSKNIVCQILQCMFSEVFQWLLLRKKQWLVTWSEYFLDFRICTVVAVVCSSRLACGRRQFVYNQRSSHWSSFLACCS